MHALEAWWTHAGGSPALNQAQEGGVLREACGYRTNTETPMADGALTKDSGVREAYAAHAGELCGFALRSLEDPGMAEEAVQVPGVRAWSAGYLFAAQVVSLRTGLFAILRDVVTDLGRAPTDRPGVT